VIVVHEGAPTRPFAAVAGELGEITLMTPDDVDRRIAASAPGPRAQDVRHG
jgi:hypothetical protein